MKLAKLSLAAVVAAGALTSVSAASLEEAIKGVDISGGIRYRVDMDTDKGYNTGKKTSNDYHKFQGHATLNVPVAENLTSVITARYSDSTTEESGQSASAKDKDLSISRAYFQFAANNVIFKAGKMEIGSPWTDNNLYDGQSGNGLFAAYTGVENFTFVAAHFFNTNWDQAGANRIIGIKSTLASRDLTALAAIGSMGPVNARLWAAKMQSVFKHAIFFEVSTKFAGFSGRAQVNSLKMEDHTEVNEVINGKRGTFWGAELGYSLENFGIKAGYTKNSKKQGIHSLEDDADHIRAGKRLYTWSNNQADARVWFITATAKFGKYGFGAGFVDAEAKPEVDGTKTKVLDGREYYVDASYAYSKNFTIAAYYSHTKFSDGLSGSKKAGVSPNQEDAKSHQRTRIEATYRF